MALTSTDQYWGEQLKIQEQEIEQTQAENAQLKLMISHGEGRGPQPKYHDEYNRELPIPPWMQMDPSGKLIEIPWMKEQYLQEHPELASGPDYIGDKLKYGQLDRILNPLGNFQRPTLDQLRIHARNYPKV